MPPDIVAVNLRPSVRKHFESADLGVGVQIEFVDQLDEVLKRLGDAPPRVLVLNISLPVSDIQRLAAILPEKTSVAWVASRELSSSQRSRMNLIKKSVFVEAGPRFLLRFSEAVFLQSGSKTRREFANAQARLAIDEKSRVVKLESASATTAYLVVPSTEFVWAPDSVGEIAFVWGGKTTSIQVRLVRVERDFMTQQSRCFVLFEALTPETGNALHAILASTTEEPAVPAPVAIAPKQIEAGSQALRMAKRVHIPRRLRLKIRVGVSGAKARVYGRVVDLSERGFAMHLESRQEFALGDRVDGLLLWPGESFRIAVEVTHKRVLNRAASPTVAGLVEYGARFVLLSKSGRTRLLRLLGLAQSVGLRGGSQVEMIRRPVSPPSQAAAS